LDDTYFAADVRTETFFRRSTGSVRLVWVRFEFKILIQLPNSAGLRRAPASGNPLIVYLKPGLFFSLAKARARVSLVNEASKSFVHPSPAIVLPSV